MKIAVLHGGTSIESEISTRNAHCIDSALRARGHETGLVTYAPDAVERLRDAAPDAVFVAVQGPGHGDGAAQALCGFLGMPYTGTRAADAAVVNNKTICKIVAARYGIPTPPFDTIQKREWETGNKTAILEKQRAGLGFPLVAKIADQGGSFGLAYLRDESETDKIDEVFRHGGELLFERFVPGKFFTIGALETENGVKVLPPVTASAPEEHDDPLQLFNRPYVIEPVSFSGRMMDEVRERTLRIYSLFKCRGYARIDYMLDEDGDEFQFIEVNAVPGLNEKSLFPYAASLAGIRMPDICEAIVRTALEPPQ